MFADAKQFSIITYSTKSTSKYGYEKPNFTSLPLSNALSETSETSYLSVNECRKTAARTILIVQQAGESTKRKLDLSEWSFELEKPKILDQEFEAKNNVDLVASDSKIDELSRSKLERNYKKNPENTEHKQLGKTILIRYNEHSGKSFTKNLKNRHQNLINIKINNF